MDDQRPEIIIARIERDLRALRAAIGVKSPCDLPVPNYDDLISVEAAAEIARCRQDTVRSWAREHPAEAGGFGYMIGARWWIARAPFIDYLRRRQK